MANKVLVAVSRIKYSGEVANPGDLLKPNKLTKEQIQRLYDLGSIRIQDAAAVKAEELGPNDIDKIAAESKQTEDSTTTTFSTSSATTTTKAPAKATPPATKSEVTDAKSNNG